MTLRICKSLAAYVNIKIKFKKVSKRIKPSINAESLFPFTPQRRKQNLNSISQVALHILVSEDVKFVLPVIEITVELANIQNCTDICVVTVILYWEQCPERPRISYRWTCMVYSVLKALQRRKRLVCSANGGASYSCDWGEVSARTTTIFTKSSFW